MKTKLFHNLPPFSLSLIPHGSFLFCMLVPSHRYRRMTIVVRFLLSPGNLLTPSHLHLIPMQPSLFQCINTSGRLITGPISSLWPILPYHHITFDSRRIRRIVLCSCTPLRPTGPGEKQQFRLFGSGEGCPTTTEVEGAST